MDTQVAQHSCSHNISIISIPPFCFDNHRFIFFQNTRVYSYSKVRTGVGGGSVSSNTGVLRDCLTAINKLVLTFEEHCFFNDQIKSINTITIHKFLPWSFAGLTHKTSVQFISSNIKRLHPSNQRSADIEHALPNLKEEQHINSLLWFWTYIKLL